MSIRSRSMKAMWIVRAGLVPNEPDDELTKRFVITSDELAPLDADQRNKLYRSKLDEANAYASGLQDPNRLNWVALEWVWY